MTPALARRLREAVAGTALAARLPAAIEPLLAARGEDLALARMPDRTLRGLARAVAAQPGAGRFLSHRPALLERLASADEGTLGARTAELAHARLEGEADLETALDALRLCRREETCLAACLQHAGLVPFARVSEFLSVVAEAIVRRALELAGHRPGEDGAALEFAVIGMGKIAGREFTHHSDLDLIFLYRGAPDMVERASRVGQRLISYLSTMTGAGVAYSVDTRLRPSGRQGMLVTSLSAFDRYQREEARTWEHVAMLRARALAGDVASAQATLDHVRERVLPGHPLPWPDLVATRQRVEAERARAEGRWIPFKTGAGGLMDVDFLAGGGLLERQSRVPPEVPSVPAMLRAAVHGARVEALLDDYDLLRGVEADARWMAGRPVEAIEAQGEALAVLAELHESHLPGAELALRVQAARQRIRAAFDRVVDAGSITAL